MKQPQASEGAPEENIIQIDVPLKNMRKLYPSLQLNNQELMKKISNDLVKGMKLSQQGRINLDVTKIQQNCLRVQNPSLKISKAPSGSNATSENQKGMSLFKENKQLIYKQVKLFSNNNQNIKYLLIGNRVERDIQYIERQDQDKIFSDSVILYSISCVNLSKNKSYQNLEFDISPDDLALIVPDTQKSEAQRMKALFDLIYCFQDKVLIFVQNKALLS